VNPHAVPSQVAVPFAGAVHAVHDVVPQLLTALLATQVVPHRWKLLLQAKPQLVPLHVAVALAGAVHAVVQLVPQVAGLLFGWQELPQA